MVHGGAVPPQRSFFCLAFFKTKNRRVGSPTRIGQGAEDVFMPSLANCKVCMIKARNIKFLLHQMGKNNNAIDICKNSEIP